MESATLKTERCRNSSPIVDYHAFHFLPGKWYAATSAPKLFTDFELSILLSLMFWYSFPTLPGKMDNVIPNMSCYGKHIWFPICLGVELFLFYRPHRPYMGVSINGGIPKLNKIYRWFIMDNPINMDDLGVLHFLGNLHVFPTVMALTIQPETIFITAWAARFTTLENCVARSLVRSVGIIPVNMEMNHMIVQIYLSYTSIIHDSKWIYKISLKPLYYIVLFTIIVYHNLFYSTVLDLYFIRLYGSMDTTWFLNDIIVYIYILYIYTL